TRTDYQSGFHYENEVLKFFATAEGYAGFSTRGFYYVYNYTDHLGNIRLSYTKNTLAGNPPVIVEENNYYPFGLKHQGYNNISPSNKVYKYKYNGKEFQDELGLNVYDFGFRNYSSDLGRWMNLDPLSEEFYGWSPYTYGLNTPVYAIDPDGRFTLTGIAAQNFVRQLQNQLNSADGQEDCCGDNRDRPFGQPDYQQSSQNKTKYKSKIGRASCRENI